MEHKNRFSIKNAKIVNQDNSLTITNIYIEDGIIKQIGELVPTMNDIDVAGKIVLPGMIDPHVHFRDPGYPHKEDLFTGSCAAAAGGVTTFFDMPNTNPPTFTNELLDKKRQIAREKSIVNFGFHFGAGSKNADEIRAAKNIPGVKVYMNHTTGNLLIENDEKLKQIFATKRLFCLHAEGETFDHALVLNEEFNNTVYLCHASLKSEVERVRDERARGKPYYLEVCIPHLFLTKKDFEQHHGFAKIKPPLATQQDQDALWEAIHDGTVDVIATDHAPHTFEEKSSVDAPYGLPGVELRLPMLLNEVHNNRLTLRKIIELCAENPAKIFSIKNKGFLKVGYDADLVVIDLEKERLVKNEEQFTRCRWTPFVNRMIKGWPIMTFVNGNLVFEHGNIIPESRGKEVLIEAAAQASEQTAPQQPQVITTNEDSKAVAQILLDKKAVTLSPDNPYTFTSGIKSPIYCDNRLLISYPDAREQIVASLQKLIEQHNLEFDVIAGTASAAIPWAAFLAQKLNKPMVYVRKKSKGHGQNKLIEGTFDNGAKVLLIEDLISTGKSSLAGVAAIREAGGECNTCVAIFTYGFNSSIQSFAQNNCSLLTITNFNELVDAAIEKQYITTQNKDRVLRWSQNPEEWS